MKIISLFCFALMLLSAQPSLKASMERGKEVYTGNCLSCHMENGKGLPGSFPTLVNKEYVGGDKKKLIGIVLNGLEGEINVDGQSYNNVMAAYEYFSDEQVADVLTYIRNSFGNKYASVTPAEVKAVRDANKK
ncbi:MAG: c-type cytochrome [Sphingobacteriales bacterium]|jgi:mono/diheme cytochrome c family protein